jgi:hypothetical protein
MLAMVKLVDFVNGFEAQHSRDGWLIREEVEEHQRVVVGKPPEKRPAQEQRLVGSALANEPSCCLQDARHLDPRAKLQPSNALSPKLRCCLQDAPIGASDRVGVASAGSAPQPRDEVHGTASNSPDAGRATCVDSLDTLACRRDRKRFSAGDSRADVVAGSRDDCKRTDEGKNGKAETSGCSNGSGDRSSGGSESGCEPSIVTASLRAIRNMPVKTKTGIWIRSKLTPTRGP